MHRLLRTLLAVGTALAAVFLVSPPALAAGLTQVTNFGNNPTNLSMYLYVPPRPAARPALLVLVHYCGGSASGIFNGPHPLRRHR
ncbi:hypothetical protein ABZS66_05285 [Dactylosporangium sp. NPDC005572]|uniref:hypothetical protein n=1 Tax=Dactylosporangium sp. NPDC005572 TaxID=3156889 RepID=UPI0033AC8559